MKHHNHTRHHLLINKIRQRLINRSNRRIYINLQTSPASTTSTTYPYTASHNTNTTDYYTQNTPPYTPHNEDNNTQKNHDSHSLKGCALFKIHNKFHTLYTMKKNKKLIEKLENRRDEIKIIK